MATWSMRQPYDEAFTFDPSRLNVRFVVGAAGLWNEMPDTRQLALEALVQEIPNPWPEFVMIVLPMPAPITAMFLSCHDTPEDQAHEPGGMSIVSPSTAAFTCV